MLTCHVNDPKNQHFKSYRPNEPPKKQRRCELYTRHNYNVCDILARTSIGRKNRKKSKIGQYSTNLPLSSSNGLILQTFVTMVHREPSEDCRILKEKNRPPAQDGLSIPSASIGIIQGRNNIPKENPPVAAAEGISAALHIHRHTPKIDEKIGRS